MNRYARQGVLKRQNDSAAAQMAYRRATDICAAVTARIASHGATDLPAFCKQWEGETYTVKTAVLGVVLRLLGRDARDAVREVLP